MSFRQDIRERLPVGSVSTLSKDDHPALASYLERELVKERDNEIQAAFMSAKDWSDIQRRRGMVDGLNAAIGLCQTIQKRLEA